MKLSVSQDVLVKKLAAVSRISATRSTLPILANVLLDATEGGLNISATNLEVGMSLSVSAVSVNEAGRLTVPARLFQDLVKSLPEGNIELAAEDSALHIRCNGYTANLKGLPADDFPMQTFEQITPIAHVSGADLKKAIVGVSPAAAVEEARPVLTGIRCVFADNILQLSATDGYRLMRATISAEVFGDRVEALLPAKSLIEAARIVRPEETVEIGAANGQYVFRVGGTIFHCAALSGDFPNLDAVIPAGDGTTAIVDAETLTQATQIAYLFAKNSANILRLTTTDNELRIEADGIEIGDNVNTVDALVTGEPLAVGVNAKYLLDALGGVDTPQVALSCNGANRPLTVKPTGSDTQFLAVIMPMALKG